MPTAKPVSERRLAANRANALKSTGPRTAEGKVRSSRNSVKHGFTATSFMVLSLEDQQELKIRKNEAIAFYRPANSQEQLAVERLALAQTHMARGAQLEAGFFAAALNQSGAAEQDDANVALAEGLLRITKESNVWALLLRYQAKAERDYRRAVQDWERLLATREEIATREKMQNEPNEPTHPIESETPGPQLTEQEPVALAAVPVVCPPAPAMEAGQSFSTTPRVLPQQGHSSPAQPSLHGSCGPGAGNSQVNSRPIASQLQC